MATAHFHTATQNFKSLFPNPSTKWNGAYKMTKILYMDQYKTHMRLTSYEAGSVLYMKNPRGKMLGCKPVYKSPILSGTLVVKI